MGDNVFFREEPKFQGWKKEDYIKAGIKYIEPMTAKELDEDKQNDVFENSCDYYIEEKFDGTRGVLHFFGDHTRVFSRRESKKSGWLTENTDSVPHIRDLNIPELDGTILDGEMFIPNRPFKDVAAIMNCTYDKAIARQKELGLVVFHAFDILYYKGIKTERMPLHRRKYFLHKVISAVKEAYGSTGIECIREVNYSIGEVHIDVTSDTVDLLDDIANSGKYPTFSNEYTYARISGDILTEGCELSYRAYYEYVVARGGEGVMIKPKNGRYYHKRGWEYSKIKAFLTRDVIITGFVPPTVEYNGKFPNDSWEYWEDPISRKKKDRHSCLVTSAKTLLKHGYIPVTKYHYENWIGNIEFGVVITDEEIAKLPKNKKHDIRLCNFFYKGEERKVLIVGECSGFSEEERIYFTEHQSELMGNVIEVMANEQFSDTGKLRHPRFLRTRFDKSALSCTWKDHFG